MHIETLPRGYAGDPLKVLFYRVACNRLIILVNMSGRFAYTPSGSTLSHRSNLNAVQSDVSGRVSPNPFSATSQYSNARTAEELESQNDEALDGLSAKVRLLKDVNCFFVTHCSLNLNVFYKRLRLG